MNDVKAYIRQLRTAADALESLLGFRDGPAAAREIRNGLSRNGDSGAPQTGFSYHGTHWTQTPAGRKHMKEIQRKRYLKGTNPIRKANAQHKKKRHHNGLHWTQKPENRTKLLAMVRKSGEARAK